MVVFESRQGEEALEILREDPQLYELATKVSFSDAADLLPQRAFPSTQFSSPPREFSRKLKAEFCRFANSDAAEYSELRRQVSEAKAATSVIVAAIAGVLAPKVGVAAAVLAPFIALGIAGAVQIGVRAFCEGEWVEKLSAEQLEETGASDGSQQEDIEEDV